ncbi:pentatricopeptide repeat-containing protein, mitochondrial-like [Capsicum chacoense]
MYDEMNVLGYHRDTHTYCIMLDGLCRNGHVEEALVFLRELERRNVDRSSAMLVIVITGLCKKGKLDIAQDINKVCSDGLHLTVRLYNTMINAICREGLLDEAKDLMRKMEQNGFSPEGFTYDFILQGFLKSEKLHEVFPLLQEMVEKGFSPNGYTFELLINLPSAESTLLDMIQEVKTQRFEVIMF